MMPSFFAVKWFSVTVVLAAVDGAVLGGVAAIISACGTLILGVLAYTRGRSNGTATDSDTWRLLAESQGRELDRRDHEQDHE